MGHVKGRKKAKETLQDTERAQLASDQNETSESADSSGPGCS